jgi:hypothetical protein
MGKENLKEKSMVSIRIKENINKETTSIVLNFQERKGNCEYGI